MDATGGASFASPESRDRTSISDEGGSAWNIVRCAGNLVALGRIMGPPQPIEPREVGRCQAQR